MAGLGFTYTAEAGQFEREASRARQIMANAATSGTWEAGDAIKAKARANIAGAGFSKKWQNAFRVDAFPDQKSGRTSLDPALQCYHKIPYAGVFESGATIAGSHLLWLPLPNVPNRLGNRHMTPKNYIDLIGPLYRIIRPGKPPLLAGYMAAGSRGPITVAKLKAGANAHKRQRPGAPSARLILVPLFFGISKVTLGKRFNIQPIFNEVWSQWGSYYLKNLKV